MTQTPVRVGVIGLGNMGKYHVKHWQEIPGAQLTGIVDIHADRVSQYSSDSIRGFTTIEALFSANIVDAVSITSPTSLHFSHAHQCLSHGLHVLIEKPIATSVDEGTQLIELANGNDRILQVGHIERFNPAVTTLLKWKEEGLLGAPISLSTERVSPLPTQIQDADVMIDLAVHDLDILTAIIGTLPLTTTGTFTSARLLDRADSAILALQYDNAIASVSVGWNSPIKRRRLTGYFKNGMVELDFIQQSASFFPNDPSQKERHIKPEIPVLPLTLELASFVSAIHHNAPVAVSGTDGILALELTLQAKHTQRPI